MTGLVGSRVNLTWSFSGVFTDITWGLKHADYNTFEINGRLLTLYKNGKSRIWSVPSEYTGRVSGHFIGNSSAGVAVFTLSNVTKDHERYYGCKIDPPGFDPIIIDFVKLIVEGA